MSNEQLPLLLLGRRIDGCASARITIDGSEYINFFGSGYLALARVPEIRAAVRDALSQGVAFTRQVSAALGATDSSFESVERAGAIACATESSVYFASGYLIGTVGLASLHGSFDLCFLDEFAHYSLTDAAKLTGLPSFTFAHCDPDSLRSVLKREVRAGQRPLVITDGVFATWGRVPPLREYAEILGDYAGRLFIDESHAFGVVGEKGRGAAEYCGVEALATTGSTLSKAYCSHGAIMGCSAGVAERLQTLPPLRGASSGSPLSAAACVASLTYVADHPELRSNMRTTINYFRMQLRKLGLSVVESPSPIVAFRWGNRVDMQVLQRRLFARGIHIYHSSYLGAGSEGVIRCSVFRDHSLQDIDELCSALR